MWFAIIDFRNNREVSDKRTRNFRLSLSVCDFAYRTQNSFMVVKSLCQTWSRKWNFEYVERKKHTIPFKNVFLEENQIHFIAIDDIWLYFCLSTLEKTLVS